MKKSVQRFQYCLKGPDGVLWTDTMAPTMDGCWGNGGFDTVAAVEGGGWKVKYWKKWDPAKRNAIKLGWKFQRVKIVEVKG